VKHPWPEDHLQKMSYTPERPVIDVNRLRGIGDEKRSNEYLLSLLRRVATQKSPAGALKGSIECFLTPMTSSTANSLMGIIIGGFLTILSSE